MNTGNTETIENDIKWQKIRIKTRTQQIQGVEGYYVKINEDWSMVQKVTEKAAHCE